MERQLFRRHIQLVRSLRTTRGIREAGLFVAEGHKLVRAMVDGGHGIELLFHTERFDASDCVATGGKVPVGAGDMARLSALASPPDVVALFRLPSSEPLPLRGCRSLVLDDVQDPANVGTLIRTAHWFGVRQVVCSPGSALAYSPKAVQASMGAIAAMHVVYSDLPTLVRAGVREGVPIFATSLSGSAYGGEVPSEWVLLLGNEGHGLSSELEALASHRVTIPSVGAPAVDSLNVAAAGAVLCAWLSGRG